MTNAISTTLNEIEQLKPTIMSYLPPEDQVSLRPFWEDNFDNDLGLFARIESIAGLAFHELALLYKSHFQFPIVIREFNEELDPSGKVLGKYLEALLQLKCDNPKEMITYLREVSLSAREDIQSLDFSNSEITDEDLITALELCPNLTSLNLCKNKSLSGYFLSQVPNKLKVLNLDGCENLNSERLQEFLSMAREIEDLSLSNLKIITGIELLLLDTSKLKKLNLSFCGLYPNVLQQFLSKVDKLEKIDLTSTNITGDELQDFNPLELKYLSLQFCRYLNPIALQKFLSKTTKLEVLKLFHLSNAMDITGDELLVLDPSKLKELSLKNCRKLNRKALHDFFTKAFELEILDLSGTEITGDELLALDPSKLKELSLGGCRNLNKEVLQEFLSKATNLERLFVHLSNISIKDVLAFVPDQCEIF